MLLFSESVFDELNDSGLVRSKGPLKRDKKKFSDGLRTFMYHSDYGLPYTILKDIQHPQSTPALLVQAINGTLDQIQYGFDPLEREEVSLGRVHPESDGVETVCSYSQYAEENFANLNGQRKDEIAPLSYRIESSIDHKGVLRSAAQMEIQVLNPTAQFMVFFLHADLTVEAVETGDGQPVEFIRDKRESLKSPLLFVLLPEPPPTDEPLVLKFHYHGDIAKQDLGLFYVDASTIWYPRLPANRRSMFELYFKTPGEYTLVASASLIDSSTVGDTLYTHWLTDLPETGVTFNIAAFEMRSYEEDGLPSVELFHNRPLHEDILKTYRKDWHKNVSESILGSLKFYSDIYGSPYRDKFRVTEIFFPKGESFPGFINLYFVANTNKKVWGEDVVFRAHEVAHQWWGSTVGIETYHDQWLSEGLATYSSLRYCHTALKQDKFFEKLREFRDNVYTVRNDWLYSGEKAGAIIQGYRTVSSKTGDDLQLIIYN